MIMPAAAATAANGHANGVATGANKSADYIDDPLSPATSTSPRFAATKRVASRETTSSSDTVVQASTEDSRIASPPSSHQPPTASNHRYAARRDYSDSSTISGGVGGAGGRRGSGSLGSPFGAGAGQYDDGTTEDGYGYDDIGLAGGNAGWLSHASTDRLTEQQQPGAGQGTRNGYASSAAAPYKSNRMSGQSGSTASSSAAGGRSRRGGEDEEEEEEAKAVEQNLERWAAAERQRRKAARSSRTGSFLGPPDGATSSLARRLSSFGRRAPSNPASSGGAANSGSVGPGGARRLSSYGSGLGDDEGSLSSSASADNLRRTSATNSFSSAESYLSGGGSNDSGSQRRGLTSSSSASSRDRKGKGRAVDYDDEEAGDLTSPFTDPSERGRGGGGGADASVARRRSVKPTATRPIVTPGRAPSIRRTPAGTPSIIVASTEGEGAEQGGARGPTSAGSEGSTNPFLTSNEAASANGGNYPLTAISEDDDRDENDEATAGKTRSAAGKPPAFTRSTTSDTISTIKTVQPSSSSARMSIASKFREIGLDDDEDDENGSETDGSDGSVDVERRRRRQIKSQVLEEDDALPPLSSLSYGAPNKRNSTLSTSGAADSEQRRAQRRRDRERERQAEEDRQRIREGKGRQPWWTEWICGCGRVVDEDNEQTGKTGPE